jgi:cytoskeletal protein RodZ
MGVGPLLRNAREVRGLSIDEAARDTKLPADQLNALEDEDFAELLGDVYVRASLRTYAVYLGVEPDEVTAIYARQADEPAPTPPPARADRATRVLAANRLRDSPRLVVLGATTILVVLIAFGVLSRSQGTPAPAPIATAGADPNEAVRPIDVVIDAKSATTVTVTIDGRVETFAMSAAESRSFTAQRSLRLEVADGASVHVVENGHDLGVPGAVGSPWAHVWTSETGNGPSPSA